MNVVGAQGINGDQEYVEFGSANDGMLFSEHTKRRQPARNEECCSSHFVETSIVRQLDYLQS